MLKVSKKSLKEIEEIVGAKYGSIILQPTCQNVKANQ